MNFRMREFLRENWILLAGDLIVIGLLTVFGFATHGTATTAGARMLTTWLPLTVAWLLTAPFLGAYDRARLTDPRQLWRPFWAMVLAAPLAAWMRGILLGNAAIQPVFVLVLGGFSALGMLAWRSLYLLWLRRASRRRERQFVSENR